MDTNNYIVCERPTGMSYEAYKELLKRQNQALKNYKKGTPVKTKQKK